MVSEPSPSAPSAAMDEGTRTQIRLREMEDNWNSKFAALSHSIDDKLSALSDSFNNKLESKITEVFDAINFLRNKVIASSERSSSVLQGEANSISGDRRNPQPSTMTEGNRSTSQQEMQNVSDFSRSCGLEDPIPAIQDSPTPIDSSATSAIETGEFPTPNIQECAEVSVLCDSRTRVEQFDGIISSKSCEGAEKHSLKTDFDGKIAYVRAELQSKRSYIQAPKLFDEMLEQFLSLEMSSKDTLVSFRIGEFKEIDFTSFTFDPGGRKEGNRLTEIDETSVIAFCCLGRKRECKLSTEIVGLLRSSPPKITIFYPGGVGGCFLELYVLLHSGPACLDGIEDQSLEFVITQWKTWGL